MRACVCVRARACRIAHLVRVQEADACVRVRACRIAHLVRVQEADACVCVRVRACRIRTLSACCKRKCARVCVRACVRACVPYSAPCPRAGSGWGSRRAAARSDCPPRVAPAVKWLDCIASRKLVALALIAVSAMR
jgi:hypothetical protein